MNGFVGIGYVIGAVFLFALAFQSGTIFSVAIIVAAIFIGILIIYGLVNNTVKVVSNNNTKHYDNTEAKVVKREPKKDNQEQFMMCTTGEDIMSHTERVWGINGKDINPFNEDK